MFYRCECDRLSTPRKLNAFCFNYVSKKKSNSGHVSLPLAKWQFNPYGHSEGAELAHVRKIVQFYLCYKVPWWAHNFVKLTLFSDHCTEIEVILFFCTRRVMWWKMMFLQNFFITKNLPYVLLFLRHSRVILQYCLTNAPGRDRFFLFFFSKCLWYTYCWTSPPPMGFPSI